MKLLDWDGIAEKGIPYHPQHIRKLIKERKFPQPVHLGGGGRVAFVETEIDDYIASLIAARDSMAA